MRKIKIDGSVQWVAHSFTLLDEKYKVLLPFMGCRSYMCDNLFKLKNTKYIREPSYKFPFNYKTGDILVGVSFDSEHRKQTFISNILKLQEIEKKAKVRKCVVYTTQNPLVLVVRGSKFWKDSCWKMMLYTFYIKTFAYTNPKHCDTSYWKALMPHEDGLLSKIKIQTELFDDGVYFEQRNGMHDKEGFVSICSGRNPPMAKLLGLSI